MWGSTTGDQIETGKGAGLQEPGRRSGQAVFPPAEVPDQKSLPVALPTYEVGSWELGRVRRNTPKPFKTGLQAGEGQWETIWS